MHQFAAGGFIPTLGDKSDKLTIVGLADARRDAQVSGQLARIGKVSNVADGDQQYGYGERSNRLDGDKAFITGKRFGKSGDFRIQHFPALAVRLQTGRDGFQCSPLHITPFTAVHRPLKANLATETRLLNLDAMNIKYRVGCIEALHLCFVPRSRILIAPTNSA